MANVITALRSFIHLDSGTFRCISKGVHITEKRIETRLSVFVKSEWLAIFNNGGKMTVVDFRNILILLQWDKNKIDFSIIFIYEIGIIKCDGSVNQ